MKTYQLETFGYYCFPQFSSLKEAREALKEILAHDMAKCQSRYGNAKKTKQGEDSYRIEFGGNLYTAYQIRPY